MKKELPKWTVHANLVSNLSSWVGQSWEFFDVEASAAKRCQELADAGHCSTMRPFHRRTDFDRMHVIDQMLVRGTEGKIAQAMSEVEKSSQGEVRRHTSSLSRAKGEDETRPVWTLRRFAKTIWSEDDATTSQFDHESLDKAYYRIYKQPISNCLGSWGGGDLIFKLLPQGIVVVESYPGNSEIRVLLTPLSSFFL
jgi:hypothetical protein